MGVFLNPDNSAFQIAVNSEIYVDKTNLLEYSNKVMDTKQALICNSRPRRFGKSTTADMLVAYYSRGCDSEKMFEHLAIRNSESFKQHLNQYDVIHFDVQWCCTEAGLAEEAVPYIVEHILFELKEEYPEILTQEMRTVSGALSRINDATGKKFIIIIDEWDALIRDEADNTSVQEEYINFLRGMFKGVQPTKFIHLAFLTGILPIKKLKTQSALNNFEEFSMLSPGALAPYIGFTEEEVKELCTRYSRSFEEVKRWYDGYVLDFMPPIGEQLKEHPSLQRLHVYNPMAVEGTMRRGVFESYWSKTGTYDSISPLISMNFDGLKTAIIQMLAGEAVKVRTTSFKNDMVTFRNKNDVLTLLIHLGYLAYDGRSSEAFIPNEEIRRELIDAVEEEQWNEFVELQLKSEELIQATLDMDNVSVAEIVEEIHSGYTSAIVYNDENSLSSVLSIAYLGAMRYYFKPVREYPTGRGYADLVFIPKREYPDIPALVVELKWNQSAKTALQQIKEKKYIESVKSYAGEILLVGINYDKKKKTHECVIEKFIR